MRLLLAFVVACSSSAPRVDPPPAPRDAAVAPQDATTQLRVKQRFRLEIFDPEPANPSDRVAVDNLATELRDIAREYRGISVGSSRIQMVDVGLMVGCSTQLPPCLSAIARSINADRILYGRVDGSTATLHLYVVATDVILDWSTDKLPTGQPELAAIAHDAMQSLLSRAP